MTLPFYTPSVVRFLVVPMNTAQRGLWTGAREPRFSP